jgi:hypothetical protein
MGIGPDAAGGIRVAAAVSQSGLKVAIRLIRVGDKSAEVGPPSLVDGVFAIPDSEPGVSIAPNGSVKAAVLVAKHPARRTLALADVTAGRNGEMPVKVFDAGTVQSPVVRAWTVSQVTAEGPPTTVWLVQTADGIFGGSDMVRVAAESRPIDLLRMSVASYVLTLDPDRGPNLVETQF